MPDAEFCSINTPRADKRNTHRNAAASTVKARFNFMVSPSRKRAAWPCGAKSTASIGPFVGTSEMSLVAEQSLLRVNGRRRGLSENQHAVGHATKQEKSR
jgi:hypothetical protein